MTHVTREKRRPSYLSSNVFTSFCRLCVCVCAEYIDKIFRFLCVGQVVVRYQVTKHRNDTDESKCRISFYRRGIYVNVLVSSDFKIFNVGLGTTTWRGSQKLFGNFLKFSTLFSDCFWIKYIKNKSVLSLENFPAYDPDLSSHKRLLFSWRECPRFIVATTNLLSITPTLTSRGWKSISRY